MNRIQILLALILSLGLLAVSSAFFTPQTDTAFISPTATPINPSAPTGPPLSLTISLICFCVIFLLVIGVIVLGVIVRNQNIKEMNKDR